MTKLRRMRPYATKGAITGTMLEGTEFGLP